MKIEVCIQWCLKTFKELALYGIGWSVMLLTPFYAIKVVSSLAPVFSSLYSKTHSRYYALGKVDLAFRGWYEKIATDFSRYGRWGYSWGDGFGLGLYPRAYNNLATYFLVARYGGVNCGLIGLLVYLLTFTLLLLTFLQPITVIAFIVVLAISPTVLQSFTHLGKPEVLWWFLMPVIAYTGLGDWPILSALLWSGLAFVNAPVAFVTAIGIGVPCALVGMVSSEGNYYQIFTVWLLGALPGVVKLMYRLLMMHRSGFLNLLAREQTGLWLRRFDDLSAEFVSYLIFSLSIYHSFSTGADGTAFEIVIFISIPILFSYSNWRLIYLNDIQSFQNLLLSVALAVAAHNESLSGACLALALSGRLLVFPRPDVLNIKSLSPKSVCGVVRAQLIAYPQIEPILYSDIKSDPHGVLLCRMARNSRFLAETDGRLRESFLQRRYWAVYEDALSRTGLFHGNSMYGDMQTRTLSNQLKAICERRDVSEIHSLCLQLGVQYFVCFSDELQRELEAKTELFQLVGSEPLENALERAAEEGDGKNHSMALFLMVQRASFIEPAAELLQLGRTLEFGIEAAGVYTVKFSWDPAMKATVNDKPVELSYSQVFDDELRFVKVVVPAPGILRIRIAL